MKLNYIKIGKKQWKLFYMEDNKYAEFYINFENPDKASGEAEILYKDVDYAPILVEAFAEEMGGGKKIEKPESQSDKLIWEIKCLHDKLDDVQSELSQDIRALANEIRLD